MSKLEINIGLFGCVSVGKSTFLNAISGCQYSDAEIKKTTMVPQVYLENNASPTDPMTIRSQNKSINDFATKKIESTYFSQDDCVPIYHSIDRICDLFDPNIIDPSIKINIYDIPGLNDSASKNIYFEWVHQNINLFDIVIFVTDISKGLNNSDEYEVLDLLMESMKKYKMKMICLINKCDDIYYDYELNDLVFEEKEQENIYIQANNILADIAKKHGFNSNCTDFTPFLPISAENCFIYRALIHNPNNTIDQVYQNRLCKNECGSNQWKKMSDDEKDLIFQKIMQNLHLTYEGKMLDTGYIAVRNIIQKMIISNKSDFMKNHIEKELRKLTDISFNNVDDIIKFIKDYINKLEKFDNINISSYDSLWNTIKTTINKYVETINNYNANIFKYSFRINFESFDELHSTMESHCMNFLRLTESLKDIPGYPTDYFMHQQDNLGNKFIELYDQIFRGHPRDMINISPRNFLHYLQIINIYSNKNFGIYSTKILKMICDKHYNYIIDNQKELAELIEYVSDNYIDQENINAYLSFVCIILLNRQQHFQITRSKYYFHYLIMLKKIIRAININYSNNKCSPLDILYEITKKNIFECLNNKSMIRNLFDDSKEPFTYFDNFMKQEIYANENDFEFEHKVLNAFVFPKN